MSKNEKDTEIDDIEEFEKMTDDELMAWVEDAKKEAEANPIELTWAHKKKEQPKGEEE